ncbi:MAG: aldehyde reductase [Pseudomonadales bacterium]|jgi:dihydroflavonol-4-reductase|tara:strand:- start:8147 stop:9157 length:1011 start_codon:yes stop_codon:yes gene_type:complete
MTKVLVTGASGFIGSHTVLEFLNNGYEVRGSIRDLARADALKAMLAKHTEHIDKLEFVAASLTDPDTWPAAVAGCDGVIHVASPVPIQQPKNPDEVIKPAREGALNVLKAAQAAGIKRIVLTSSVAAVSSNQKRDSAPQTAEDWTDVNHPAADAYGQSKTLAEQAAWDFVKAHEEMELVTIQPAVVLGPALEADYGSSLETVYVLMQGKYPMLPHMGFSIVDVRDVAHLHRIGFEQADAAGQRLLCSNGFRWFKAVSACLIEEFPAYKDKLATRELPDFVIRILALFDPVMAFTAKSLGTQIEYDCSPAKALGWNPRSPEDAIKAGAKSLIDLGVV